MIIALTAVLTTLVPRRLGSVGGMSPRPRPRPRPSDGGALGSSCFRRSSSLRRNAGLLMRTGTAACLPTRTIFPFSVGDVSAIHLSSSAWVGPVGGTMWTADAVTVPLVEGVQASTSPTRLSFTGATMWPEKRSLSQPLRGVPSVLTKGNGSRRPLVNPHAVICLTAHSAAALWLGDPVSRGPYTS